MWTVCWQGTRGDDRPVTNETRFGGDFAVFDLETGNFKLKSKIFSSIMKETM
jgi:hypothetical protein